MKILYTQKLKEPHVAAGGGVIRVEWDGKTIASYTTPKNERWSFTEVTWFELDGMFCVGFGGLKKEKL